MRIAFGLAWVIAMTACKGRGATADREPTASAVSASLRFGDCADARTGWTSGPRPLPFVLGEFAEVVADQAAAAAAAAPPRLPAPDPASQRDPDPAITAEHDPSSGYLRGVPAIAVAVTLVQDGNLTSDVVGAVLAHTEAPAVHCVELRLATTPLPPGVVAAELEIGAGGHVTDSVANGIDPSVSSCIAALIRRTAFPPPSPGTTHVTATYTLSYPGGLPSAPPARPASTGTAPPHHLDYQPGAANPLAHERSALAACIAHAKPAYGVAVVELVYTTVGDVISASAFGPADDGISACIAKVGTASHRIDATATQQRCSFAYGTMPVTALPAIDITDATFVLPDAASSVSAVNRVAIDGPVTIRASAAAPASTVLAAAATLVLANRPFVLAVQRAGNWQTLRPIALPVVPTPRSAGAPWDRIVLPTRSPFTAPSAPALELSILVGAHATTLAVTAAGAPDQLVHDAGYARQLDAKLAAARRERFSGRTDLVISVTADAAYADLVLAIEAADRAGFHDWMLAAPSAP